MFNNIKRKVLLYILKERTMKKISIFISCIFAVVVLMGIAILIAELLDVGSVMFIFAIITFLVIPRVGYMYDLSQGHVE